MIKYKRILTDADEELALAIKYGENDLLTNFQEYWKKKCGNLEYLCLEQVHSILISFALDNFLKEDWYEYQENIKNKLYYSDMKKIGVDGINNALLQAIRLMRMYYFEFYLESKYQGEINGFKIIDMDMEDN